MSLPNTTQARVRVLLIGWDGADWKVINPLIEAGRMPNLERLINRGVMGNMATLSPALSPMLWTSIATGKRPYKHGVHGFTEPDPQSGGIRPISSLSRKTRAIWNVLNLKEKVCNVIGWWPSYPVEPIDGVMVSNHYHRAIGSREKPWPMPGGTIHPQRLVKPLADLRLHPEELDSEHILPFVSQIDKVDQDKDHRLVTLAKLIAECSSVHSAATAVLQREPWDFSAVYYDSIDHFSHAFMGYHPPKLPVVSDKDFEIYQGVIEAAYEFHDAMLGVLMAIAGDDCTIMLMSDHGFHSDHLRPQIIPRQPAGPAVQHSHYGIFVMAGPQIKEDERIYGANLLDVTPTILTLFGLPVGSDMDGKVLVQAFKNTPKIDFIDSWDKQFAEDNNEVNQVDIDPTESYEALNQLVDLGYIDKPDDDKQKAVAQTLRENKYNLARSYMCAQQYTPAAEILKKLSEEWPDEHRIGLQLIECYQALNEIDHARKVLDLLIANRAVQAKAAAKKLHEWQEESKGVSLEDIPENKRKELFSLQREATPNPYAINYLLGVQLLIEGKGQEALNALGKAKRLDPNAPGIHLRIGQTYASLMQWDLSEESYQQVLELDPDNCDAFMGLCRSYLSQRRNMDAVEAALNAIGQLYFNPTAHYLLGVALLRVGRLPRAIEAFKVCLAQNPNHVRAHKRLAHIYKSRLHQESAAAEHLEMASRLEGMIEDSNPDDNESSKVVSRVPMASDQNLMQSSVSFTPPMSNCLEETAVIVSGLPRSGSSMMMQMLEAGGIPLLTDGIRSADEDNQRGYYEYEPIKNLQADSSCFANAIGKGVKIVVPLLGCVLHRKDIPIRVVFMDRDLDEVINSQRTMLARKEKQGAALLDNRLWQVFNRQLNQTRNALSARKLPVLYVSHSECISNPHRVAMQLNEFLGGDLDIEAIASCVDPTLYRHRNDADKQALNA